MARRNKRHQPRWTPFEELPIGPFIDSMRARGIPLRDAYDIPVAVYLNSRYQVHVHRFPAGTWPGVDLEVNQLSIKRIDKREIKDWREFQRIKTEILGPDVEGIELYPREDRLLDTANQYHLWCLPAGQFFPFGYFDGRIVSDSSCRGGLERSGSRQRPLPEYMEPTHTAAQLDAIIESGRTREERKRALGVESAEAAASITQEGDDDE